MPKTHRRSTGPKLFPVHVVAGRFEDIKRVQREHERDLRKKKPGPFDEAIRELERYAVSLKEFCELKGGPSQEWKNNCREGISNIRHAVAVLKAAGKCPANELVALTDNARRFIIALHDAQGAGK